MAAPCEVRLDSYDKALAESIGHIAETEALRIERKFSHSRADNVVAEINGAAGAPMRVDDETADLLDYAEACWRLSKGRFDITCGVLRRVWRFDGSDQVPRRRQVRELMPFVGWGKVLWRRPHLTLRPGMEIDLGGLDKEYAVDSALGLVRRETRAPVLIRFGGDVGVTGPRAGFGRWRIAVEPADESAAADTTLEISVGAVTTSGDARRFLLRDGVRYGHVLDPRTGWAVKDAPRSVSVAADTCMEAGLISTLAMLQGRNAEKFLRREGVRAWWVR